MLQLLCLLFFGWPIRTVAWAAIAMCVGNCKFASCHAAESLRVGRFLQEVALHRECQTGLANSDVLRVSLNSDGRPVCETAGGAFLWSDGQWNATARPAKTPLPSLPAAIVADAIRGSDVDERRRRSIVLSDAGVFEKVAEQEWTRLRVVDAVGRVWNETQLRAVTYDDVGNLWLAGLAGVACRTVESSWTFYEGRDGLPYNDFTCAASAPDGSVWFGTSQGAIHFRDDKWAYRQGLRWLPHDEIRDLVVDDQNSVWLATANGVGRIAYQEMSLQQKAEYYESEIDRYIKRTEYGYVANARVVHPGDTSQIMLDDNDNDGLWTAMYGASQCFAYGVTKTEVSRQRAKQAFEALRFLQVVTQTGKHRPPVGYVARTILPGFGADPNTGRMAADQVFRAKHDKLWKVYEPRWPLTADGNWYWKSDTSSDELDGHYFFHALYYDLVADSESERERVRSVVRDLTDHLINHDFVLQDHDGSATRWGVFRPASLNNDPNWWHERGLNSLSMLSYLAVAHHVTGDDRYEHVARKLRDVHGYAANVMTPKVQRGIGSGNQSDDEMAMMSFYSLCKYTRDQTLRKQYLQSFYGSWMLEQPERNPFFHFAYASQGSDVTVVGTFAEFNLSPWGDWLADSVATLQGFPLDRFNWSHHNSHRLDLMPLPQQQAEVVLRANENQRQLSRGYRVDGKVLPVEERHFEHWNTDPWRIDYDGDGRSLGSGAVYLLPYYMGRYHGFLVE